MRWIVVPMVVACAGSEDAEPGDDTAAGAGDDTAPPHDTAPAGPGVAVTITGHDRVVSEDGELTFVDGGARIASALLVTTDGDIVPWLTDQALDLADRTATLTAVGTPPAGTYDRLRLTFAPFGDHDLALSATLQDDAGASVAVAHPGPVTGEAFFESLALDGATDPALAAELTTLTFYVRVMSEAQDGVFGPEGPSMDVGFLEQNLVNVFRVR